MVELLNPLVSVHAEVGCTSAILSLKVDVSTAVSQ